MRLTFPLLMLLLFFKTWSQNPATIFSIPSRNIVLPCGTNCTSISAIVPNIKQSDDYIVTSIPYLPFAYSTPAATEVLNAYNDDKWSTKIGIGFPFCFYGITYPTLLMGSNSNITFDTIRAGASSGYAIFSIAPIPNVIYAPATIFGPYHDLNANPLLTPQPADRKIEYRVEGIAPKRRFIASYNDVPYYHSSCTAYHATHEMVLYEGTGVIEVYIQDKPYCPGWNGGLAILGIQNKTRTKAVAPPGKNATQWGSTGMKEAYRFTPYGGSPQFKKAELLVNGSVVALADTATGTPGNLNLNFSNVCPTQDSTAYVLRVTYRACSDTSQDISFDDTVYVKKAIPALSLTTQNATCTNGGTITASLNGATGTFQYSLNGGAAQTSNIFTNLTAGNYIVTAINGSCSVNAKDSIALINNLAVSVLPSDTSLCIGAGFTPVVSSSATSYSWAPTAGLSSSSVAMPTITATQNTQYTVTATQGQCTAKSTLTVTVFSGAQANAGPDQTIITGDQVQLLATGSAGSYLWSPSTGISATNILQPFASPVLSTTYTFKVTTSQGCTASDDVLVTVVPYCVKPMEAFTPNGDGINDLWLVTTGNCLKSAKVAVFNRYGSKVFESQDYKNNWDGTYKGAPLPDGTYYYIITYQLINGKTVYQKGNVTILR